MIVSEVVVMPGRRLDVREREVIERGVADGWSHAQIAVALGRSRSTVSREVAREARKGPVGRRRAYRAVRAQRRADRCARRPKPFRLVGELGEVVTLLLELGWSPQQISARLPELFADRDEMRVSHETIYQSLFVQSRGELRRELTAHLRTQRTKRKAQGRSERRGKLVGIVPISERPAEADDRAVPGHWEGDLVLGAVGKGAVITLVERHSRFVMLAPLPDQHRSIDLQEVLTPLIASLPDQLRRSLTWDQGKEMALHAKIALAADIDIYFADPHSPWQRGSNENTNGLLRQFLPKGCDMRELTQADCDDIAALLNTRPRQTLNWQTPAEALDRALGATTA
jgi:IS30 family transposase